MDGAVVSTRYPDDLDSFNYGDYDDGYADGLARRWPNPPDATEPHANEAYRAGYAAGTVPLGRRRILSAAEQAACIAILDADKSAWETKQRARRDE